jgi:hypothetical protein
MELETCDTTSTICDTTKMLGSPSSASGSGDGLTGLPRIRH